MKWEVDSGTSGSTKTNHVNHEGYWLGQNGHQEDSYDLQRDWRNDRVECLLMFMGDQSLSSGLSGNSISGLAEFRLTHLRLSLSLWWLNVFPLERNLRRKPLCTVGELVHKCDKCAWLMGPVRWAKLWSSSRPSILNLITNASDHTCSYSLPFSMFHPSDTHEHYKQKADHKRGRDKTVQMNESYYETGRDCPGWHISRTSKGDAEEEILLRRQMLKRY